MNQITTTLAQRLAQPKSDVIAMYIGFLDGSLRLHEVNTKNLTVRMFTLAEDDASIPPAALTEAKANRGTAFNQVKVYNHPNYIEYFHVHNTKVRKHDFWVRRDAARQAA